MNYKGIVFFDYDGTLADEKEGIFHPTEKTVSSLKSLEEKGYLTVLSTGRAKCYVPNLSYTFGGLVTSNGAYAEIGGHKIFEEFIPREELLTLVNFFDDHGLFYSMENQERAYAKDVSYPLFRAMLKNFKLPEEIFSPFDKSDIPNASKMLLGYDNDDIPDKLTAQFGGAFTFDRHRKFLSCDINKRGMNKALGAGALIDYLGISHDNVYAFGDGANDYDILKLSGHGIAMGYHARELEEVSEYITDTVVNEGITKALEHYNLI